MGEVTSLFAGKIFKLLFAKFVISFDGWSSMQTHFLFVCFVFPSCATSGLSKFQLSFSPFEDEKSLNTESNKAFLKFVLSPFLKELTIFFVLLGTTVTRARHL